MFYWPSMFKTVELFVASCDIFQRAKASSSLPIKLLYPLPILENVWDDLTTDFLDGLQTSHGKNSIMVVVDRLSKYAHFMAFAHFYTAKIMAVVFIEGVVKLHGLPMSIISDRDPIFTS